jgi:uncharacterized protein (TIGR03435 family)
LLKYQFIGLVLLAQGAFAQSPFVSFEVATIKPTPLSEYSCGRYLRMQSAHQFQAKAYTVNGLIAAAYDLTSRAVLGGPPWAESDRFEILAVTPGETRPAQDDQIAMLRKLLTDRFGLAFHREKKEFSIYELTVAKTGPKLIASQAPPDQSPTLTSTVYPAASGGIDKIVMPARNATVSQFASILQRAIVDRPVVDTTGISGRFDFDLEWTPDESQFGGNLQPGPPDNAKPSLYTAIEQQLGLRLQAAKGPVEALVIERVERPSEN